MTLGALHRSTYKTGGIQFSLTNADSDAPVGGFAITMTEEI